MPALAILAAFCAGTAAATSRYYIPDSAGGSGTWADSTRWYGGVVPQNGDLAYVTNGIMRITLADLTVVSLVGGVYPDNPTDVVQFDLDIDFHFDKRILGKGKIVKNGTGALYLDTTAYNLLMTTEGIEVNGGEVHLSESVTSSYDFEYGPLAVNAPGKLFLRSGGNSKTPGISGDGIITNISLTARQLIIVANDASKAGTAYSFSGTISPNVQPTFNGAERQDLLSDQTSALAVRAYAGNVGVSHFGNKNSAGSLGTADIAMRSNDEPDLFRYLYIGDNETTDKNFVFYASPTPRCTIDGGENGNLVLSGEITMKNIEKMACLYLDGSNTERCTVSGAIKESGHASNPKMYLTKRGTGTWRIEENVNSTFRGGIAVEKGVLEAVTIKEAGVNCSLGRATSWQSCYWTVPDASKDVPYAILLGDGAVPADSVDLAIGTLSYVGSVDVSVTNRPIALDGAGRLRNDTERAFSWRGIFSKSVGDHVLALDGEGVNNAVSSVTNGPGNITVVKEGSGTWRMEGDFDAKAFDVRGGTLDLSVAQNYTWYRFNVKELWNDEHTTLVLSRFALLDEGGTCCNTNLFYRSASNGATYTLKPGMWAFWTNDYVDSPGNRNGSTVGKLFVENGAEPTQADDCCVVWRNNGSGNIRPVLGDESSWFRVVMRVAEGSPAITKYDICANVNYGTADDRPNDREVKSWSLDASRDGVNWIEIASVTTNQTPPTANLQWYSTRDADFNPAVNGYDIASEQITALKPTELDYVSVAAGATLISDKRIPVKELRYDMSRGGGTLEGFAFADNCVLRVVSAPGSKVDRLPITFRNVTGIDDVSGWTLVVNGKTMPAGRLRTTADGFAVYSPGMLLIYR